MGRCRAPEEWVGEFVVVLMNKDGSARRDDFGWSFVRDQVVVGCTRNIFVCTRGSRAKGVVAVGEHFAGMVAGELLGLGTKVPEHGVGFPAAKELDGFFVDVGTKKGGGTA